ncbi:hypothetical protein HWD35_19000 [Tsukamurella tyrosinosolvens]|uniref:hypothetical protein n=1 Tax=Tsukamurella tyrosinosolvens TaxID=57704 RepID=UPI001CE135C0|nr:hypothetical protein [Tsukamurella tyrosinosolvens]MCA4996808.1 hypothetical protein [Tsukamurella tyrosinosolvens]
MCTRVKSGAVSDYWSSRHVVEIKEITDEKIKSFADGYRREIGQQPHVAIPGMKSAWTVMVSAGDSPEIPGQFRRPRLKHLAERLAPHLLEVEASGVAHPNEIPCLWYPIRAMLGGAQCDPLAATEATPGIYFVGWGIGHSRPCEMNRVIVDTVQDWLASTQATNVVASLREARLHRVAALTCDTVGSGLAIWQSLDRDFPDVRSLPTRPLAIPDGIDSVVILAGDHVLRHLSPASSKNQAATWSRMLYTPTTA